MGFCAEEIIWDEGNSVNKNTKIWIKNTKHLYYVWGIHGMGIRTIVRFIHIEE